MSAEPETLFYELIVPIVPTQPLTKVGHQERL